MIAHTNTPMPSGAAYRVAALKPASAAKRPAWGRIVVAASRGTSARASEIVAMPHPRTSSLGAGTSLRSRSSSRAAGGLFGGVAG
jgi:hypothetical protein